MCFLFLCTCDKEDLEIIEHWKHWTLQYVLCWSRLNVEQSRAATKRPFIISVAFPGSSGWEVGLNVILSHVHTYRRVPR